MKLGARNPLFLVYLLSGIGFTPAAIADVDIEREISVESKDFTGTASTAEIATPIDDLGEITADFSALDDEPLYIQWKAPAGKMIKVTYPPGFTGSFLLQFLLRAGTTSANDDFQDSFPDVEYSGLSGDTPTANGRFIQLSGPSVEGATATITENLAPGESFQFRSLTASTTVEASYDENIDNLALTEFVLRGTVTASGMDTPTDPGQWIQLVDIASSLDGLVIDPILAKRFKIKRSMKKVKRSIRSAKRSRNGAKLKKLKGKLRKLKAKLRAL